MFHLYQAYLDKIQLMDQYRQLQPVDRQNHTALLDFTTNDYLCLSAHPAVIQAGQVAAAHYGMGATGSRLLSGNYPLCTQLEAAIAKDKKTDASLIFNSGFQANISTLACILDDKILNEKPLVFFDKLNHSSLYQAVFLTKSELKRYHHNDINHLEFLLKEYQHDARPKFIVTETVFGMDGDVADLNAISALAYLYKAFLYLDESHATGVLGSTGYGLSNELDLQHIPHIIMGTLSKAIGTSGGYIACHHILHQLIVNKATGFMYSTAPSPAVIGASLKAWELVPFFEQKRTDLHHLAADLRHLLQSNGFDTSKSQTHIIPIILKEEKRCLKIQKALLQQRIMVACIRPPTVPPHTARLRISLNINHTKNDVVHLMQALHKANQQ